MTEYHSYLVTCLDKTTGDNKWMRYFRSRTPWAISVYDKTTQKIIDRMYKTQIKHFWRSNHTFYLKPSWHNVNLLIINDQFYIFIILYNHRFFYILQTAVTIWSVNIFVWIPLAAENVCASLGTSSRAIKSRVKVRQHHGGLILKQRVTDTEDLEIWHITINVY